MKILNIISLTILVLLTTAACTGVGKQAAAQKPKLFKDRLAQVRTELALSGTQVKTIRENKKALYSSIKTCKASKDETVKKSCTKDAYKKYNMSFLTTLSKEQKNKFNKLRKEAKIFLP